MVHIDIPPSPLPAQAGFAQAIAGMPDARWFSSVLDALTTHIAVLDKGGMIVAVNGAWVRFAAANGGGQDHGVGVNYMNVLHQSATCGDASARLAMDGLQAILAGEQPHFELEYPCHSSDQERWFLMQATPLPDGQGCVVWHTDISRRKRTEQAMARLVSILEATTDFVGIADPGGRELYANRAMRQMRGQGLSPNDPLGRIPDNHPEWAYQRILQEGLPGAARDGVWGGESAVLDAAGSEIPVHQVILAHRDEAGEIAYFSTIMRDISASRRQEAALRQAYDDLKRTQDQLAQSEKMASIGQLAAGVAHEINNPIGYLHSNLGTLGQYIEDVLGVIQAYENALARVGDPAIRAEVEQAKQASDFDFLLGDIPNLLAESREGIQRVRKIVLDLKDFAHAGDNEDWQWTDLRHSLTRTLNIVHNELKYKAEVIQDYGDIPEIRCLPGQLNQVFMNLLVNAAHAIEAPGQVHIRAWHEAEMVHVSISDTGCGMPAGVMKRIFEPFYTTKPVGKGTGLGLSISYGIVQKHGGHIRVESQLNVGTTFHVVLPVSGPPAQAQGKDKT